MSRLENSMSRADLERAWNKYHTGHPLSDVELLTMIDQAEAALEYLEARGSRFYLATSKTHQDIETLRGYRLSRGL